MPPPSSVNRDNGPCKSYPPLMGASTASCAGSFILVSVRIFNVVSLRRVAVHAGPQRPVGLANADYHARRHSLRADKHEFARRGCPLKRNARLCLTEPERPAARPRRHAHVRSTVVSVELPQTILCGPLFALTRRMPSTISDPRSSTGPQRALCRRLRLPGAIRPGTRRSGRNAVDSRGRPQDHARAGREGAGAGYPEVAAGSLPCRRSSRFRG